jgi:ABC-type microcin C transport system duplicated ATPase subunit YejF
MSPLLEVEDLGVQFDAEGAGVVQALDGVTFAVDAGRALAIVGDPGSGKTVAALTAVGLTRGPRVRISGRVGFEGQDLLDASDAELRQIRGSQIGMTFADPVLSLHPLHTTGWQVAEAITAHHRISKAAARDRAIDLLELVGISDPYRLVRSYPHQLSDELRRRATIAMAIANEPKLLIADEPTNALDREAGVPILKLLAELRERRGMALLILTRDRGVARAVGDEIYTLPAPTPRPRPHTAIPSPAPGPARTTT